MISGDAVSDCIQRKEVIICLSRYVQTLNQAVEYNSIAIYLFIITSSITMMYMCHFISKEKLLIFKQ